jgi:hypothetical protein
MSAPVAKLPIQEDKPAPKPLSGHGLLVESFNGLEPTLAIPGEQSRQNWQVGRLYGKSSIDKIEFWEQSQCVVVYSSLGVFGKKPEGQAQRRVFIPLSNIKDGSFVA